LFRSRVVPIPGFGLEVDYLAPLVNQDEARGKPWRPAVPVSERADKYKLAMGERRQRNGLKFGIVIQFGIFPDAP
jgi:hypothetical protein